MKSFATISGLFKTTLVAAFALTTLSGCGDNAFNPISHDEDGAINVNSDLGDAVNAASGKTLFDACESNAMLTLSLSEVVQLTPFIEGTRTPENSTLSELVAVTPVIVKFQTAFNAEMASLSVGEVSRVTQYMDRADKNRCPYPEFEDGSQGAIARRTGPDSQLGDAVIAASGKAMFEACESNAMLTLSLSEVVQLTPYITGDKTAENSTLSELVAITPIVVKFQIAFNAEVAGLSVGDVVKVARYMDRTGKNKYPFPELGNNAEGGAIS